LRGLGAFDQSGMQRNWCGWPKSLQLAGWTPHLVMHSASVVHGPMHMPFTKPSSAGGAAATAWNAAPIARTAAALPTILSTLFI
jgi:hypothetical protein